MKTTETNKEFYFRVINPEIRLLIKIYRRKNEIVFLNSIKNALNLRKTLFEYGMLQNEI